jgi:hypothetical protein
VLEESTGWKACSRALYGCGLRLTEGQQLRIKDVDPVCLEDKGIYLKTPAGSDMFLAMSFPPGHLSHRFSKQNTIAQRSLSCGRPEPSRRFRTGPPPLRRSGQIKPNQTESNRIKPNQAKSNQPRGTRQTAKGCPKGEARKAESIKVKKIFPALRQRSRQYACPASLRRPLRHSQSHKAPICLVSGPSR